MSVCMCDGKRENMERERERAGERESLGQSYFVSHHLLPSVSTSDSGSN